MQQSECPYERNPKLSNLKAKREGEREGKLIELIVVIIQLVIVIVVIGIVSAVIAVVYNVFIAGANESAAESTYSLVQADSVGGTAFNNPAGLTLVRS